MIMMIMMMMMMIVSTYLEHYDNTSVPFLLPVVIDCIPHYIISTLPPSLPNYIISSLTTILLLIHTYTVYCLV